ncbi:myrcene synthase, chloroplastic-like [Olea europaea subsp. europaea]|uniref:Myrcene synthase, chloroplastic-like n=1 Tax=Olea europaea subsp. europaea TaxID=158383 RepID=A0A8S0PXL7_OLEEU|nr:myrcene synthase, chloroplastic-like [Olea europaea subsp. europaea]
MICFAFGTTTASLASNAVQYRILATAPCNQIVIRRSGKYKPPIWEFDYIQSLNSEYTGERYITRASELKMQVKMMLDETMEPLEQVELIDNLERLGISYHFEDEIEHILAFRNRKYSKNNEPKIKDLYATALEFRLLRQHGFNVSQDRFYIKNEKGDFKPSSCNDTKGLLQLDEASFLSIEGESTLEMAREFTIKHLEDKSVDDIHCDPLVHHALGIPLHWTIPQAEESTHLFNSFNGRFINKYDKSPDMNPILLQLAKLDFNTFQAKYLEELKYVSRWWKRTCLAEKLPFARDRLVESFFWSIGVLFEPQYGISPIDATKVNIFITVMDDIYDVYGTLEELELFTFIIERWDVNAIEQLPDYMQIFYLALNNIVNEMAYGVLKEKGIVIIPYLRKVWIDLCKAYLQEAKWCFSGYTPTMEEYMENALISISAHVILSNSFFSVTNPIEKEAIQCLEKDPDIVRWSATILRLADDLATSSDELERGDVPKSIQCYTN